MGRKPQGWRRPSTILDAIAYPTCYLYRSFAASIDVLLVPGVHDYGTVNAKGKGLHRTEYSASQK
jgi:hypothetical protein